MRANERTPESRYPLPVLPADSFHPWNKHDMSMHGSVTGRLEIISSKEQFQQLQAIAEYDNASVGSEVRGAIEPYVSMWLDQSNYYDIPFVDEMPQEKDMYSFTGHIPMTQLWRLATLSGIETEGCEARMQQLIYSANDLYIERRFRDNKAVYGNYLLRLVSQEIRAEKIQRLRKKPEER